MSTPDQLAAEMAAALANTFPRIRISQLEPVQAVARGVFALMDERINAIKGPYKAFDWLEDREARIAVLAECLATWQAESMEQKVHQWCNENPRRMVSFEADYCFLTDEHGDRFGGQAATPGEALGKALIEFDAEGTPDE